MKLAQIFYPFELILGNCEGQNPYQDLNTVHHNSQILLKMPSNQSFLLDTLQSVVIGLVKLLLMLLKKKTVGINFHWKKKTIEMNEWVGWSVQFNFYGLTFKIFNVLKGFSKILLFILLYCYFMVYHLVQLIFLSNKILIWMLILYQIINYMIK